MPGASGKTAHTDICRYVRKSVCVSVSMCVCSHVHVVPITVNWVNQLRTISGKMCRMWFQTSHVRSSVLPALRQLTLATRTHIYSLSLSLSLSHTHTQTHTHTQIIQRFAKRLANRHALRAQRQGQDYEEEEEDSFISNHTMEGQDGNDVDAAGRRSNLPQARGDQRRHVGGRGGIELNRLGSSSVGRERELQDLFALL